jgi:F-type H+-transporting ATPase subunit epsilon
MSIRVHVDVVSAEELIFSGQTDFAVFPGEAGELGIYPRHTPLLTRIRPGTVRLKIRTAKSTSWSMCPAGCSRCSRR